MVKPLDNWQAGRINGQILGWPVFECYLISRIKFLEQGCQELHLANGSEMFVPLCGESRDIPWLRKQEHSMLDVGLSAIAVQAALQGEPPHPASRCQ